MLPFLFKKILICLFYAALSAHTIFSYNRVCSGINQPLDAEKILITSDSAVCPLSHHRLRFILTRVSCPTDRCPLLIPGFVRPSSYGTFVQRLLPRRFPSFFLPDPSDWRCFSVVSRLEIEIPIDPSSFRREMEGKFLWFERREKF